MPSPGPPKVCQAGFAPATDGLEDRSSSVELLAGLRPSNLVPVIRLRMRRDVEVTRALPIVLHAHGIEGMGGLEPPTSGSLPHPVDPVRVGVFSL